MARLLMSDEEWAIFEPFLVSECGRPPSNHRCVLDGIFWMARTGSPWRDLPPEFGKWNSVWKQFRRWAVSGVWDLMLQGFADSGGYADMLQMIDGSVIRARPFRSRIHSGGPTGRQNGLRNNEGHRCAAGIKGGFKIRPWAAAGADFRPRSTCA